MNNWKFTQSLDLDSLGYDEIVVVLQDVLKNKQSGTRTRNKVKKLLKYLSDDEFKFKRSFPFIDKQKDVRKEIKRVTYMLNSNDQFIKIEKGEEMAETYF